MRINETEAFNGPERVPDAMADDLKQFMLNDVAPSRELIDFATARHPFMSRWQVLPFNWTTFVTITASEKAEHYWRHYLYTLDRDFLASEAYPMLRGAAEFYRNFPNLKRGADGHYHIFRTHLHEHIIGGTDVIDDLVFIKGVMQAATKAAEILGLDTDLRPKWQTIVDQLTPYPMSGEPDAIGSISHPTGKATWCQGRTPAVDTRALYGADSPRLRMVENYDVLTLETRDQQLDDGDWDLANSTFEAHPGYSSNMEDGEYQYAGGRYLLDPAKLGRPEYMTILQSHNQKLNALTEGSPNRLGFTTSDLEEWQGYGIFRTPWPGQTIALIRSGGKIKAMTGALIKYSTDGGETIKLIQQENTGTLT